MSFNLALIHSESARRAPDRPVAVFDGGRLTYRLGKVLKDELAVSWGVPS